MPETAKLLQPGFSVADAEYPSFSLLGGALILQFVDWREKPVRVRFLDTAGVKWQQLESSGPEDRNDSIYEIVGSSWLDQFAAKDVTTLQEGLHHFRLCFNEMGVLDVLATSMELVDATRPDVAADGPAIL